jgi:hydrogenase/urease accessory protein HupE
VLIGAMAARAHVTATGLATISIADATIDYQLTVVVAELPEHAAALVRGAVDGEPSSVDRLGAALRGRVTFRVGNAPCRPGRGRIQGTRLGDGRATLAMTFACPSAPGRLSIRDDWAEEFGEHYRTIGRLELHGSAHELVFTSDAREAIVEAGRSGPTRLTGFFRLGVEHILTGYDHLLFLTALLLRGGGTGSLLKIITAFTAAHSVTLALAALGIVTLPDRLVEPLIAASIVWVALENVVRRDVRSTRWIVSFAFGLVHGFGFAAALDPLALPAPRLALALLGFNLGVEAGQACVVVALVPLLAALQHAAWAPRVIRAASIVLALVGLAWLVERLLFA